MHHKNILLVSATTRLHERMRELSHVIDVSIALANAASFSQAAASGHTFDLIILDQKDLSQDVISTVENYSAQNGGIARLFVADLDNLSKFVLPVQGKSDFILSTATIQEFSLRCSLLLWPGTESTSRDLVLLTTKRLTWLRIRFILMNLLLILRIWSICCCRSWQRIRLVHTRVKLFCSVFGALSTVVALEQ